MFFCRFRCFGKWVFAHWELQSADPSAIQGTQSPNVDRGGFVSVLLLRDPFSHYVDAEVEDAALALLQASGIAQRVLSSMGTARPCISKGFLKSATPCQGTCR